MPSIIPSASSSTSANSSAVLQHIQSLRDVPVEEIFTKLDIVGKGAYGAVYKGIHNATGTVLALKVINLDTAEDDMIEIQREVALLSQLRDSDRHNCIGYHGCYFYQTELWIAMDYASGGSIRTLLKPGKIDEKYAQLIIRETLIGMNYIHHQDIIHRDIKSANILLTNSNRIVLCDFGIAAPLQSTNHKRSTFIGTPYWMAPEVITDGRLYDTKADIWSLGITLYEILNGNPPFSDLTPAKVILKIPRSQPAKLEGNQFTNAVKEFLAACLIDEPNDRPSAEELMKHKWIKSIAKAPLSPLKDLTLRYSRWINSGGIRQSLADISSPDLTARPDSLSLDKSDWDFMADDNLDPSDLNSINSNQLSPNQVDTSKEGAATVRPSQNPPVQRQMRAHRLLKLFEEEPTDNAFNQFNFQNPFSHSNINPQSSPLIGLGFPVPGLPSGYSESMNDIPPPIISIPSTEELDSLFEPLPPTPLFVDHSNLNRPFSPSNFNRSLTPTPNNFQRLNSSNLPNSGPVSANLHKLMTDGSLMTPPLSNSSSSSETNFSGTNTPNASHSMGISTPTVTASPSLPIVSRKNSITDSLSSNRNRAYTAPPTQDNGLFTSNPPSIPSPMQNRPNLCGGRGKQFAGNGFSFGGPSAVIKSSSTPNSQPVTPLSNTHPSGPNLSYTSSGISLGYGLPSPAPSTYQLSRSPDRERNLKAAGTNLHGQSTLTTISSTSGTASISRSRPSAESTAPLIINKPLTNGPLHSPSILTSHSNLTCTTPTMSSSKHSNSSSSSAQLITHWPTGDKIKINKSLNYHELINLKDVKIELENNLSELSQWLETCEIGLSKFIEAIK
ncbi:hypothetical protein O181_015895 [Austropuccinia psidii MF-1]|uniref:non-specific serine/threonine protein kinase n=1 Tax=Austropuccinia psidii MF-1 TaxID=1389203 RepID=A0A9Q3C3T9_9BASI|nr:hypothetical protein [Austropuccinia psidii MF-1]